MQLNCGNLARHAGQQHTAFGLFGLERTQCLLAFAAAAPACFSKVQHLHTCMVPLQVPSCGKLSLPWQLQRIYNNQALTLHDLVLEALGKHGGQTPCMSANCCATCRPRVLPAPAF